MSWATAGTTGEDVADESGATAIWFIDTRDIRGARRLRRRWLERFIAASATRQHAADGERRRRSDSDRKHDGHVERDRL